MKYFSLLSLCGICLLITACQPEPSISIDTKSLEVPAEGGTYQLNVSANYSWTATPDSDHVTISPSSGNSDSPVTITVGENPLDEIFIFEVTFQCTGNGSAAIQALTITQACENPSIDIDNPEKLSATSEGGDIQINVISNYPWSFSTYDERLTINPVSGDAGTIPVTITVPVNESLESTTYDFTLKCENQDNYEEITYTITQSGMQEPEISLTYDENATYFGFDGGEISLTVESNYPWTAECPNDFTLSAKNGSAGTTEIKITVPSNSEKEDRQGTVTFMTNEIGGKSSSQSVIITISKFAMTLGDVDYSIVKMADGRIWMAENLRYIPEGHTPSSDPTDDSKLWYPCYLSGSALTDEESITTYGYLYAPTLALGVTIEELATDINAAEGAQGICPDGWHIPTEAEADALLEAYWNEDQKGAPISALEEAGFNPVVGGMINRSTSTATGRYMASDSGFFLTSTGFQYKVNENTGAITSQNRAIMRTNTATYQRYTVANASNYAGVSIRCIKNAE